MTTIMKNLAGALLIAVVTLGTGSPQTVQEISLSDIRAQQPRESIYASDPCQWARESPTSVVHPTKFYMEYFAIHPNTFVGDLKSLMERSDEVIVARPTTSYTAISPNGKSTASYAEFRVIHSWKGTHPAGATLTFGRRGGLVECSPNHWESVFSAVPNGKYIDGALIKDRLSNLESYDSLHILFLRYAQGEETHLVQGLLPAGGEGLQGEFEILVPRFPFDASRPCWGVSRPEGTGSLKDCYVYLRSLTTPVRPIYEFDPLAAKYYGKPLSSFIEEIQTEADSEEPAQKSDPR